MTPLSIEYCRRARLHLAAVNAPEPTVFELSEKQEPRPVSLAAVGPATPRTAGPKVRPTTGSPLSPVLDNRLIGVGAHKRYLAKNRARLEETWARLSVIRGTMWKSHGARIASIESRSREARLDVIAY
jgi:hypothetical protein